MSDLRPGAPGRVPPEQIRMRSETADDGFRVGVAIDAASHGTPLLLGLAWIRPGTERVSWHADADTHETYYIQQGRLLVAWDGENEGETEIGPGDSFYFPPGRVYSVENVGDDEVSLVWNVIPSP